MQPIILYVWRIRDPRTLRTRSRSSTLKDLTAPPLVAESKIYGRVRTGKEEACESPISGYGTFAEYVKAKYVSEGIRS